jgi:putative flavoprotein involved in K+ transport
MEGPAQRQTLRRMESVKTIVIGAGQAGLALSSCLTDAGEEHLLLERGQVAQRWRSERWDSFRLLTPNWQTRLPGYRYSGPAPDGFMRRDEIVDFFDAYAQSFAAPVRTGVTVLRAEQVDDGWRIATSAGTYRAANVVVATGHYEVPRLPTVISSRISADIAQVRARDYRNPDGLPPGAVLVVGAGPTGQQIADELARAGRRVYIAVGRHRPLPRRYRGYDAYWWLDRMGSLHRRVDSLPDSDAAANAPSVVLSGEREDLHLRRLVRRGVTPLGHLSRVEGTTLHFADDLHQSLATADDNATRFRSQVDAFVAEHGLHVPATPNVPQQLPRWATGPATTIDMIQAGMSAVVWATGYRRDHSWIAAPVFSASGAPVHSRGITPARGLMFLGLRFMYRRNSNFIDGVGADAAYLADSIRSAARSAA